MRDRHGRTREAGDALLHLAKEQSLAIRVLDVEVKDESAIQDAVAEILRETPRIDIDMVVSLILPQKGNLKADAGNEEKRRSWRNQGIALNTPSGLNECMGFSQAAALSYKP